MTKKEFQRIGNALLPELPGFAAVGQLVFVCPIQSILRAICFDRSIESRGFYVEVFFQPLFVPTQHIGFNIGWRLGGGSYLWLADDPDLIRKLRLAIQREALPFLLPPKSPSEVAQVIESLHVSKDPYVQQAIAYCHARDGNVTKATKELERLIQLLDVEPQYDWQRKMSERAASLKSMLLADPLKAQRQLTEWELWSSRNLGLQEFLQSPTN